MSRTQAIAAKCKGCVYAPLGKGTWREQVADCASVGCPLHAFRPVPTYRAGQSRDEAIREARGKLAAVA